MDELCSHCGQYVALHEGLCGRCGVVYYGSLAVGDPLGVAAGMRTKMIDNTVDPGPLQEPCIPRVVTLCGSTKFLEAFRHANLVETLAGRIVLSVGCFTHSDAQLNIDQDTKEMLDELHKRKIDISDEILVLNVGGYVGESTRSEIEYAQRTGKIVRWLEEPNAE